MQSEVGDREGRWNPEEEEQYVVGTFQEEEEQEKSQIAATSATSYLFTYPFCFYSMR